MSFDDRVPADLDTGLSAARLKEMAAVSTEKVYDADDIGAIATMKASLSVIQQAATNLAERMAEAENELAISGSAAHRRRDNSDETNPISVRAQAARKELEETKVLSRFVLNMSLYFGSFGCFWTVKI